MDDAIGRGEPQAAERLLPAVYGELRKLAAAKLAHEKPGQTLDATALVHEAYLRLVSGARPDGWDGRGHFFAAAAEAMRRILIDQARLLTLKAAWMMDIAGNKVAKTEIAMIKVAAPNMACQVIDWAMQVHGGGGVSDDTPLAYMYAGARTIRFADGPDEVHRNQIAKLEIGEQTTVVEALSKKKSR